MRISAERERRLIVTALTEAGVARAAAGAQADWLVEADLRGHPSHGIQRLPVLVERVRRELVNPTASPRLDWATESALLVDGDAGLGPWAGLKAMTALIERTPDTGVTVAAMRNAHHLGLLSLYVERAAARGLIGLALTTSEALVHPWGGARALIGTNPIAVAIPARPAAFVLDMATSEVSMGKVIAADQRGDSLEPGWAIDSDGQPTDDPARVTALTPFGGAKGYGLGLAIELLVGVLSRTALGEGVLGTLDVEHPPTKGDLFVCLAPERFGVAEELEDTVDGYLAEVRRSSARGGRVSIPGDGARRRRAKAMRDGVELPEALVDQLRELVPGPGVFA